MSGTQARGHRKNASLPCRGRAPGPAHMELALAQRWAVQAEAQHSSALGFQEQVGT